MIRALATVLVSSVWAFLSKLSRVTSDRGWIRQTRLPVRVISVGNFEVGGTGKTPVVAALAREALGRGFHPVVLTRGYRGKWESTGGVIAPRQASVSGSEEIDPFQVGDEPCLLHDLVPEAWVGIGADRVASFWRVRQDAERRQLPSPDLAILDDGLQHHCLSRDVELVLMTSARPWQRVFREFPGFLRAPVLAAWTKGGSEPWGWRRFQERIRVTWGQRAPEEATGLWLVTGVAQGQQVRRSLEAAGWRVDLHHDFKDHAGFERDQVRDILEKAGSAGLKVALTGKDWVKWRALGVRRAEVEVFEPEMILDEQGRRAWSRVLWGS